MASYGIKAFEVILAKNKKIQRFSYCQDANVCAVASHNHAKMYPRGHKEILNRVRARYEHAMSALSIPAYLNCFCL